MGKSVVSFVRPLANLRQIATHMLDNFPHRRRACLCLIFVNGKFLQNTIRKSKEGPSDSMRAHVLHIGGSHLLLNLVPVHVVAICRLYRTLGTAKESVAI